MGNSRAAVQRSSKLVCLTPVWPFQMFQKVLLSHPVWEQSFRTCLLQVALGLHRTDVPAPGPHGCHSSVARLVHLWAHEAMLWFGAFH